MFEYVKKIPILSVIEYYGLPLKKGYLLCPFHNEKTPSAKIYEEENTGYCFGCHKIFDSIELVRKFENLNFEKAIFFLYQNFTTKHTNNIKKNKNISLYKTLNNELRNIFKNNNSNIKMFKIAQLIDINAENNLLILKLYASILRMV